MSRYCFIFVCCCLMSKVIASESHDLYRWSNDPVVEKARVNDAHQRLARAIKNPEYALDEWIDLPSSPAVGPKKKYYLHLRDAILLALRYNPNIQNAELDRIVQRYQLRLAKNQFELQYALAGSAIIEKARYSGVGNATTTSYIATPELDLNTAYGGQVSLGMDNNIQPIGGYNPLLNFTVSQPLLRGFGRSVNEAALLDAVDNEWFNKLNTRQSVIDQITQVITAYRALILSGNNLKNQRLQLKEADSSFEINKQRIAAGQLAPTANIQQSYQIESLRLMLEQAENDFNTRTQDLLQAIGLDPEMRLAVPNDVQVEAAQIPSEQEAIAQGLAHNVQYLALKLLLRADERAYKVAKDQQLWQLDLKANVQAGTMTDVDNTSAGIRGVYNGRNITESAGVMLTVPMHDINRRSQLINAKVRLEKDKLNLIAAKRSLITLIKNTIFTIKSQAKRYALAKKQVELATKSYDLEKRKLQAGISTALDVNQTQNQLIGAQMGLISAKIAYLNELALLQRILGTTLDYWKINLRYGG